MDGEPGFECTRRLDSRARSRDRRARYSGGMTRLRAQLTIAAALVLLFGAAGQADDERKDREKKELAAPAGPGPERAPESPAAAALASAAAQGFSGSSGTRMELFGRAGLVSLNASVEDSLGLALGVPDDPLHVVSASQRVSEFGWGAGARLMSGSWGIEGTYTIFESLALSPGWLIPVETGISEATTGVFELPVVPSRADVFVGQVVRAFPLSGGRMELFIGLGAGWMRATDSSTDRLLSGAGVPGSAQITGDLLPDAPPELVSAFVPEIEFTADRSSLVYAGSVGLSMRVGRILLRPRVDVIIARALTTELTVGFPGLAELGVLEAGEVDALEFIHTTSVTPRIFMFSVDIGLGN